MKIQLKRSNVLEGSKAKAPTSNQMEFGEIAVNYNTADPVLFIKDSSNQIIRLDIKETDPIGDGQINVDAGDGLSVSGSNATANQITDTTRVLTAVAKASTGIEISTDGIALGGSWSALPVLPSA